MFGKIVGAVLETAEDLLVAGLRTYRIVNKAAGTAVDQFVKDFQAARPKEKKAGN